MIWIEIKKTPTAMYLQWWKQLLHNAPSGDVFVWLHGTPQATQSFVWFWPLFPSASALLAFSWLLRLSLSVFKVFELLDDVEPEPIACEFEAFDEFSPIEFRPVSLLLETLLTPVLSWFVALLLLPPFWFGLAYFIQIPNGKVHEIFFWDESYEQTLFYRFCTKIN